MQKKEFVDFEVNIIMFMKQDVFLTESFNGRDFDDDPWNGFEWGEGE